MHVHLLKKKEIYNVVMIALAIVDETMIDVFKFLYWDISLDENACKEKHQETNKQKFGFKN